MTRKHKLWALMPALPKDLLVASVRQYEDAGLEGVWSPQLYGAPFVPLAAAANLGSTRGRFKSAALRR